MGRPEKQWVGIKRQKSSFGLGLESTAAPGRYFTQNIPGRENPGARSRESNLGGGEHVEPRPLMFWRNCTPVIVVPHSPPPDLCFCFPPVNESLKRNHPAYFDQKQKPPPLPRRGEIQSTSRESIDVPATKL